MCRIIFKMCLLQDLSVLIREGKLELDIDQLGAIVLPQLALLSESTLVAHYHNNNYNDTLKQSSNHEFAQRKAMLLQVKY